MHHWVESLEKVREDELGLEGTGPFSSKYLCFPSPFFVLFCYCFPSTRMGNELQFPRETTDFHSDLKVLDTSPIRNSP